MGPLDLLSERRQRVRNTVQALLLLAGLVAVAGVVAWLLAGWTGVVGAAIAGALALGLRPRVPPDWVLRAYRARLLPWRAAPELHRIVTVLARRAGLPVPPALYYVPSPMCNAFAVGRRGDAAIGVTDGLLRTLTPRQLVGVLAHELSHVRADDLWVMSLADIVGRLTQAMAYAGVLLLLLVGTPLLGGTSLLLLAAALIAAPTTTTLLQLGLSRAREHDADLEAAALTGDPDGLASALLVLERVEGRVWERLLTPRRRGPDLLLLRTHPRTQERVRRLRALRRPPAPAVVPDGPIVPDGYRAVARRVHLRPPGVWR